ncbi:MAG: thioredoxin domain-containing protein [Chloroflexota bacterium]
MTQLKQPITKDDHIQGKMDALVSLVLYGDYQCPYTRLTITHINALQRRFGDQLAFVYRHFPAPPEIHPFARPAAEAALAAAAQGKFWEMHTLIFRNQLTLDNDNFPTYAAQLSLDLVRFRQELANHTHEPRMWRDLQGGWESGVRGAPVLFINNERFEGTPNLANLIASVEQSLANAY